MFPVEIAKTNAGKPLKTTCKPVQFRTICRVAYSRNLRRSVTYFHIFESMSWPVGRCRLQQCWRVVAAAAGEPGAGGRVARHLCHLYLQFTMFYLTIANKVLENHSKPLVALSSSTLFVESEHICVNANSNNIANWWQRLVVSLARAGAWPDASGGVLSVARGHDGIFLTIPSAGVNLYRYRTCPVQTFGRACTNPDVTFFHVTFPVACSVSRAGMTVHS